ncbi:hypothetical protein QOT17_022451 [Balamuthia mandrillaris]
MVVPWSVSFPFNKGGAFILLLDKELQDSLNATGSALLPPFTLDVVVEVGQNLNNLVWVTSTVLQLTGVFLSSWCRKKHDLCAEGKAGATDSPVIEELAMSTSLMDLFCNMGSCSCWLNPTSRIKDFQPLYHVMAAILGRAQLSSKVKLNINRKHGITAKHKKKGMACSIKLKHFI